MNVLTTAEKTCKKCNKQMSKWEYHPDICCFTFYQCTYGVKDFCIAFPNVTETEAKYKIIHIFYQAIGRTKMQEMMHFKAMWIELIPNYAVKMKEKIKRNYYCGIISKFEIYGELPNELIEMIAEKI